MKTTHPIAYVYVILGTYVTLTRYHRGTAYPTNGNVGNATEYFGWSAQVDGVELPGNFTTRVSAYEHARAHILGIPYYDHPNFPTRWRNVRNFREVQAEMKANYQSRAAA